MPTARQRMRQRATSSVAAAPQRCQQPQYGDEDCESDVAHERPDPRVEPHARHEARQHEDAEQPEAEVRAHQSVPIQEKHPHEGDHQRPLGDQLHDGARQRHQRRYPGERQAVQQEQPPDETGMPPGAAFGPQGVGAQQGRVCAHEPAADAARASDSRLPGAAELA